MWFFIVVMTGMFCCRKLGWTFSRGFLYAVTAPKAVSFCILWGGLMAFSLRLAINTFHPGIVLKVIGFGAGAYAAIPNYGLISESTIPPEGVSRHNLLKAVPWWTFIGISIALAFLL